MTANTRAQVLWTQCLGLEWPVTVPVRLLVTGPEQPGLRGKIANRIQNHQMMRYAMCKSKGAPAEKRLVGAFSMFVPDTRALDVSAWCLQHIPDVLSLDDSTVLEGNAYDVADDAFAAVGRQQQAIWKDYLLVDEFTARVLEQAHCTWIPDKKNKHFVSEVSFVFVLDAVKADAFWSCFVSECEKAAEAAKKHRDHFVRAVQAEQEFYLAQAEVFKEMREQPSVAEEAQAMEEITQGVERVLEIKEEAAAPPTVEELSEGVERVLEIQD